LFGEDEKNNNTENVDRQELKVSLKLFLYSMKDDDLTTAVNKGTSTTYFAKHFLNFSYICGNLYMSDSLLKYVAGLALARVDYLDTVVVTFSGRSEGSPLSLEEVQRTWATLEEMVNKGKVKVIGLSDVDTQLFIQLHAWAAVKPGIIQINLASCCVVPPELSEFCKQQGIQLLTHSDPISKAALVKIIN
jgi:hypothetical protein